MLSRSRLLTPVAKKMGDLSLTMSTRGGFEAGQCTEANDAAHQSKVAEC